VHSNHLSHHYYSESVWECFGVRKAISLYGGSLKNEKELKRLS